MVKTAVEVRMRLKEEGYNVTVVNARFVKPVDENMIIDVLNNHKYIITMEENVINGGYGERVLRFISELNEYAEVINIAIPNVYVEHGNVELLKKEIGIDTESIVKKILRRVQDEVYYG